MTKTSAFAIVVTLVAAPLASTASLATGSGGSQPRAWVSVNGADAPSCGTGSAPCRTFQYAHDNIVQPGGTIYVQGPGNYGQLVIAHAISIINDGVGTTTIFAASGDAIDIQAGVGDAILIKGLILDGVGTGSNGINLTRAGGLTVTNTTIRGFGGSSPNGNGVLISPTSGTLRVDISDTLIVGNGGIGIWIAPGYFASSSASVTASLTRVQANENGSGVVADNDGTTGTIKAVADQVTASNNTNRGFEVYNASLYLTRCAASGNGQFGVFNGPAGAYSAGDNAIYGNGTNVNFSMTSAPLQ